jgi:5-methylcytosine-specific restriction endonuclease McrA
MPKKKRSTRERIDGLSPDDLKKLRSAIRQVWSWSHPRRLAKKRCQDEKGFFYCEKCDPERLKPLPSIAIDHIKPCGDVTSDGYIERMWTPSKNLQGLCKPCHRKKTNEERKAST